MGDGAYGVAVANLTAEDHMEPFLYDLTSEEGRDALIESLEATLAALEEAEQERSRVLAALDSTGISRMTLPTKAVKAAVVCQECVKALRTGKGWRLIMSPLSPGI